MSRPRMAVAMLTARMSRQVSVACKFAKSAFVAKCCWLVSNEAIRSP